jgi:hypothetical protein
MKLEVLPRLLSLSFLLMEMALSASAQPSGGPYGPVRQTYTVPADAAHVYFVSPDGTTNASGVQLNDPTTLASAIARVVTGDVIVLRGGTYRIGDLKVNQGVTLQPYGDECPVLKGTRVATEWKALRDDVWCARWATLFPQKPADWWRREREGMRTPLHRFNNDMVFVDGRALQSAGWEGELDTNTFSINYEDGNVFIRTAPSNHVVEITAFDSAIVRTTRDVHGKKSDGKGLIVRGLTFTQYAYRAIEVEGTEPEGPADPATYGKDVVGSTFENVTISHCSRVAGYFRGDKTVFRNCLISDTSTEGVYIIASSDCLLERNIFARNNVEHITGYFPSAVKIFNQTWRVVCRDNVVMDQPDSNGIWYDVGNHDGVFVNNWVENSLAGFFFEISKGAICAGNVFVNCENGVHVLNSTNVQVYHNTFMNAPAVFERTTRSAVADHFGWHPSTGPDVDQRHGHILIGNLFTADETRRGPLLQFKQAEALCGKLQTPQVSQLDYNVYVRSGDFAGDNLLTWSPAPGTNCTVELDTLEELRRLQPGFDSHGIYLSHHYGSPFNGPGLKRYELNASLANLPQVPPLPPHVQERLAGLIQSHTPGAYPRQ